MNIGSERTNSAQAHEPLGRKTVALWGSYNHGNFGDDLMAVIFASRLKASKATPLVYGVPRIYGERYHFDVTDNVNEMAEGAECCVVGGGALLAKHLHVPTDTVRIRQAEFEAFSAALQARSVPAYLLSVGSQGDLASSADLMAQRRVFLQSGLCRYATVRLPNDASIVEQCGVKCEYIPDVLLDTGSLVSTQKTGRCDGRIHIGLNLPRTGRFIGVASQLIAQLRPSVCLHFLNTVDTSVAGREPLADFLPPPCPGRYALYTHRDPVDMVKYLASLDMVITHKLHLGVVALSLGLPYVALAGAGKCRAFMESVGAPHAYHTLPGSRLGQIALLWRLLSSISPKKAFACFQPDRLRSQIVASQRHLDVLAACVSGGQ